MKISLDEVELAVAVNVEILRQVLKKLSGSSKTTWWIACEPAYAFENGYLTVACGCPGCTDPLNTVLYRMPILNRDEPPGNPDKLVVLIDSSVIIAEQPGLYRDGSSVQTDELSDIEEFILPIRRALVPILAEYTGATAPGCVR
jgi:hypothetical protein